jgi:hypothetical protein
MTTSAELAGIPPTARLFSSLRKTGICRFHSARHFHPEPADFFLNFLETPRTLASRGRLCGARLNSGFFFACSDMIAVAELRYYSNRRERSGATVKDVLQGQKRAGKDLVLLHVEVDLDRILSLEYAARIRWALEACFGKDPQLDRMHDLDFIATLLPADAGGSTLTDSLGHWAFRQGYAGVKFPSVRLLEERGLFPPSDTYGSHGSYDYADLRGITGGDELGDSYLLQMQVAEEWNLVVFRGSELTRSISEYSWQNAEGASEIRMNPYFGISAADLETVRLEARRALGLTSSEALSRGLVSDAEITEHLEPETCFVRAERGG